LIEVWDEPAIVEQAHLLLDFLRFLAPDLFFLFGGDQGKLRHPADGIDRTTGADSHRDDRHQQHPASGPGPSHPCHDYPLFSWWSNCLFGLFRLFGLFGFFRASNQIN